MNFWKTLLAWATVLWLSGCGESDHKVLGFQEWVTEKWVDMTSKYEEWWLSPESQQACDDFPELVICALTPTHTTPEHISNQTDKDTVWETSWEKINENPF